MIAIPAGAVVTFAGYCLDGAMDQAIISADLEGFRAGQLAYTELGTVDAFVGLITRIGPRWTRVDLRALERQLLSCQ